MGPTVRDQGEKFHLVKFQLLIPIDRARGLSVAKQQFMLDFNITTSGNQYYRDMILRKPASCIRKNFTTVSENLGGPVTFHSSCCLLFSLQFCPHLTHVHAVIQLLIREWCRKFLRLLVSQFLVNLLFCFRVYSSFRNSSPTYAALKLGLRTEAILLKQL